ncbi:class C sortase [Pseudoclavibacter sp. CFCC 13796]|nr:class C sortase [Pseudoclavibacter sp. CFCC 13796]
MLGIAVLLYPTASNWFAERAQQSAISGYNETVQTLSPNDRQQKLAAAEAYNSKLPAGVLRDPYTNPDANADTAAYSAYRDTLNLGDNGMIGELSYPRLSIDLPIYHGTSSEVLATGAGHLFGSSLPIGGPSTHAVLTSHSGLTSAQLFTPLHQASAGDTFTINVLGETHYYQVQSTEVITPDQTDHLRIVNGQDLVTLITCTPIGINSHRLLVTAARIPAPDDSGLQTLAGHPGPGFPWWAVIFVAVSGAAAYILFVPPRRRRRTASTKELQ